MSELPVLTIDRIFKAPRELVWRAWTDPLILHEWYGPNIETVIHKYDLKPGGSWLNEMKMQGNSDFSKMVFQEVDAPAKLVWHQTSTDKNWNIHANPMMPDWPSVLLTTVLFKDQGETTNVRFSQVPLNGTDAEVACFAGAIAGMSGGWGKGFAIMDELLEKLQSENS